MGAYRGRIGIRLRCNSGGLTLSKRSCFIVPKQKGVAYLWSNVLEGKGVGPGLSSQLVGHKPRGINA